MSRSLLMDTMLLLSGTTYPFFDTVLGRIIRLAFRASSPLRTLRSFYCREQTRAYGKSNKPALKGS